GVGGCGKTRLALEIAARSLERFGDGAFMVDLAPVGDAPLVARTVAGSLGMSLGESLGPTAAADVEDLVVDYLSGRNALVVLDNCEHLLDACVALADRLLGSCPHLTLIATSREPLQVEGEHTWRVPSLGIPSDERDVEAESVRLFSDRAAAVRPDFALTDENRRAVADICRRLDGIPLALELAAARVAHLSAPEIASRLGDRFRILTGGRGRVQRQQTLQAAMDWSFDLLSEEERALLRRLSVFAGGFTFSRAERICAGDPVTESAILDLLGSLAAKSLIVVEERAGATRYRLLETVRIYAEERLASSGESDAVRSKHRDSFLELAEAFPFERSYWGDFIQPDLEAEQDNLRAAISWSSSDGRFDLVARMAISLLGFWRYGRNLEGTRWLTRALEDQGLSEELRLQCLSGAAGLALARGDPAMGKLADEAIQLAAGRPSFALLSALVVRSGYADTLAYAYGDASEQGNMGTYLAEAFRIAEGADPLWLAICLFWRGFHSLLSGDLSAALDDFNSIERLGVFDDWQFFPVANRYTVICLHSLLGNHDEALRLARVSHEKPYRGGPYWHTPLALGLALAGVGDWEGAHRHVREAFELARDTGISLIQGECLVVSAACASLEGDYERASRLLAAATNAEPGSMFIVWTPSGWPLYRHYLAMVRDALGRERARELRAEGQAMALDQAVAYALEELK
ncbi:MAG: ATP-binding protein, partial [Actinomycetota bacterium]